jgi:hypothetical protein
VLPDADKRLLGQVLGLALLQAHAPQKAEERALMAQHKLVKCA